MTSGKVPAVQDDGVKEAAKDKKATGGIVGSEGVDARRSDPVHPTRVQESVRDPVHGEDDDNRPWAPPSNLVAPTPRPGYVQRWIRTSMRGTEDPSNIGRAYQEGWHPRRADSVPKDFHAPTIKHGQYAGFIGTNGMILCEMPAHRNEQRKEYYRTLTERQTQAIENDLAQQSQPGMPITQVRKSQSRTARRSPPVAADS